MICDNSNDSKTNGVEQLRRFRQGLYGCFSRWKDALFELGDALCNCPTPTYSTPALSLEPEFRRSHGSLYKALDGGDIDLDAIRSLLAAHMDSDRSAVFAVDATTWDRCDAETSDERGYYHSTTRHLDGKPIVAGWRYQLIAQLNWEPNSWTSPLDQIRLKPGTDTTEATIAQIKQFISRLQTDSQTPMFVFDAGYDPIALSEQLEEEPLQMIVRLSPRRVFYSDPEPQNRPGRPRRHGKRFKLSDPNSWHEAEHELVVQDPTFGTVTVHSWSGLHPQLGRRGRRQDYEQPPIIRGTIIRIQIERLPKSIVAKDAELWLWWSGPDQPDLDLCWRAYLRRFDIEHTIRFLKHTLGWTIPMVQTPKQADLWTWLIISTYTQLRLARPIIEDVRLPWERPLSPTQRTPARTRRAFRLLRKTLDTPAHPPKTNKPGPGRPKGTRKPRRKRYPPIKAAA